MTLPQIACVSMKTKVALSSMARKCAAHINDCFTAGQALSDTRMAEIIDGYFSETPSFLDKLIPEIAGKTIACLDSDLVLMRFQKTILLVLTKEEYEKAIGRGKAVIRIRRHRARLKEPFAEIYVKDYAKLRDSD